METSGCQVLGMEGRGGCGYKRAAQGIQFFYTLTVADT